MADQNIADKLLEDMQSGNMSDWEDMGVPQVGEAFGTMALHGNVHRWKLKTGESAVSEGIGEQDHPFDSSRDLPAALSTSYGQQAQEFSSQHLQELAATGTNGLYRAIQGDKESETFMQSIKSSDPTIKVPLGPGFNYFSHLFNRSNIQEQKKATADKEPNIVTDQPEAVKLALRTMGVFSERNPTGLPIDIRDAKKLFFGTEDVDPIDEAEWRTSLERGSDDFDPKKVRKFVNYDGSLTWEILNDDKTVMSRFTMGEYSGTKIFSQGGHTKFADLLKQVRSKIGPDHGADFDAIRGMFE